MTKENAIRSVKDYLGSHNIECGWGVEHGSAQLTMAHEAEAAPGKCIESCVWFYPDGMEARVYYSALGSEICRKSRHIDALLRVLNFVNARVFLSCSDGSGGMLYAPHMLYTPRIYITADGSFDITITTIIPYDFYEIAPVGTGDYLTAYCPELLERLTPAIFGVLLGRMTADRAIDYITTKMIQEG